MEHTSAKAISVVLGSLLGLTDYADGFLARKWRKKTFLGALLDPIADKIFISTVFLILSYLQYVSYPLVFLLLFRELLVSLFRSWFPEDLRVINLARLKTLLQMMVAGFIILAKTYFPGLAPLADYLLLFVIIISYLSALPYLYRFVKASIVRPYAFSAFLLSLLTLIYPLTLLYVYPFSGRLFFLPILALNLYFFRKGLSKTVPFKREVSTGWYWLTSSALILESIISQKVFYSLFFLLGVSIYLDGLKTGRIIWEILRIQ